jgi:hypothetical protein
VGGAVSAGRGGCEHRSWNTGRRQRGGVGWAPGADAGVGRWVSLGMGRDPLQAPLHSCVIRL